MQPIRQNRGDEAPIILDVPGLCMSAQGLSISKVRPWDNMPSISDATPTRSKHRQHFAKISSTPLLYYMELGRLLRDPL